MSLQTRFRVWPTTLLDAASVSAFTLLVLAIGARLVHAPWSARWSLTALGCAVLGYLLADLFSGIVHWAGDTFLDEDTPIVGPAFIHPFREHHRDPLAITRHGFLEVNGNNCLGLVPLLAPTWWWLAASPASPGADTSMAAPWLPFQIGMLAFSLTTFGTNQFHKWAHLPGAKPVWITWLQHTGLVLSPEHHALHHAPPHRRAYCVTVGWMNALLDPLDAFSRAERLVLQIGEGLRRLRKPQTPGTHGHRRATREAGLQGRGRPGGPGEEGDKGAGF